MLCGFFYYSVNTTECFTILLELYSQQCKYQKLAILKNYKVLVKKIVFLVVSVVLGIFTILTADLYNVKVISFNTEKILVLSTSFINRNIRKELCEARRMTLTGTISTTQNGSLLEIVLFTSWA